MSARFPTSYVPRFNHRASFPVPYTRAQWLDAVKLPALNNWRLVGPSTAVTNHVRGVLQFSASPAVSLLSCSFSCSFLRTFLLAFRCDTLMRF
jgi:lipid-A-disaccharide synthase-like uncharacterized protein